MPRHLKSENHKTYLPLPYKVEEYLKNVFIEKIKNNKNTNNVIEPKYSKNNIDDKQKEAIKMALNSHISIITGGAGTGKTTVIRQIYENINRLGQKVAIVSFTGKAVSRLKEVIGNDSPSTMHMKIYQKNKSEPFNFLDIDETSMVTCKLIYDFFMAHGIDYKIVLVGDINQLPPISWGTLFAELMTIREIPKIKLMKNYRSDVIGENGIIINAENLLKYHQDIKNSGPDDFVEPFRLISTKNFSIIENANIDVVIKVVSALKRAGIKPTNVKVLYPHNRDFDGVLNIINKKCQEVFNIGKDYVIDKKGYKWMIGDCVIMTKNNYGIGIMNGDEGVIIDLVKKESLIISANKKTQNDKLMNNKVIKSGDLTDDSEINDKILVKFQSGKEQEFIVTYNKDSNNDYSDGFSDKNVKKTNNVSVLKHSYGSTIHESQGSEKEFIIKFIPSVNVDSKFKNRYLMYTGLTRARRAIWIICQSSVSDYEHACMRNGGVRYDTLAYRINMSLSNN